MIANIKRRGQLEILFETLLAIKYSPKITHIIMKANSSYAPTKKLLDSLIEHQLVHTYLDSNRSFYFLTESGESLLLQFQLLFIRTNPIIEGLENYEPKPLLPFYARSGFK